MAPPSLTVPVQPERALAWFRRKVPVRSKEWDRMGQRARERALRVAGIAQLALVADVLRALDAAMEQGTSLETFKAAVQESLEAKWKGSVSNPASRVETIFRTNTQSAYGAGRYEELTDPDVADARPYWQYSAILDHRVSPMCEVCDGLVVRNDSPFWNGNYPPKHFNCRCTVLSLTEREAQAEGISTSTPDAPALKGFGMPPTPRNEWKPKRSDYNKKLWKQMKENE